VKGLVLALLKCLCLEIRNSFSGNKYVKKVVYKKIYCLIKVLFIIFNLIRSYISYAVVLPMYEYKSNFSSMLEMGNINRIIPITIEYKKYIKLQINIVNNTHLSIVDKFFIKMEYID